MSVTFTKLFSSITESTVWCEPDRTRLMWITMLAMSDRQGRVWASVPGLANRARVPIDDARTALQTFMSPDLDSRTPEWDGKRIEAIDGGWRLLNYDKYRAIKDKDDQDQRNSAKQARHREKLRLKAASGKPSEIVTDRNPSLPTVTQDNRPLPPVPTNNPIAEAEAEAEAEAIRQEQKQKLLSPLAPVIALKQTVDPYLEAWNEHCGDLAKVLKLSDQRKKKVAARVREGLTLEQFTQAVKLSVRTAFLRGKDEGGWRCSFDWLVEKETNLLSVLEGKYGEPDKPKAIFVEVAPDDWLGGKHLV